MRGLSSIICTLLFGMTLFSCSTEQDEYSLDYFNQKYGISEDTTQTVVVSDTLALAVEWNGLTATVTGETDSVTITQGATLADIIISTETSRFMEITLTGEATDGSLLVYALNSWGLVLNGVSLTNEDGPAINNQGGKWLYVTLADDTENHLTDGATWADAPFNAQKKQIDQKGTLFSEGQMHFSGSGKLYVSAIGKNGIACDDYVVFDNGDVTIDVATTGANGLKVNDGLTINDGTLGITVLSAGGRGIKDDSYLNIAGGTTTISTKGGCKVETVDGVRDTTSAAGIKCDSLFTMTAGQLTITSTGDGGKGINCSEEMHFKGGTLKVNATGTEKLAKPKGVKSDKQIVISGGHFESASSKSKACDSGGEDTPVIQGTPKTKSLDKRKVVVIYE